MKKLNSLLKLWFILIIGALIPIAFTIILNLGLIFQWSYPFDSFYNLIYNLSTENPESLGSGYLIGIASSFVVFFAIASWIYSFNYITPNVVRKYILKHKITFLYFGIQFGYGLSLSYFSYFQFYYNLNYVLSIVILISSIITSVVYFYWLSKIILPRKLFSFLFNKINFEHLGQYEKKIKDKKLQLESDIKQSKLPFKTKIEEFFLLFNKNVTNFTWEGEGYIQDINIKCIDKLLEKYTDNIEFVLLLTMIGDSLPKEKLYKPIRKRSISILLTIRYKPILKPTEDSIGEEEFNKRTDEQNKLITEIEKLEKEIIKCFTIEESGSLIDNYNDIIEDIFSLYNQKIKGDYTLSKIFFESLSNFFMEIFKDHNFEDEWTTDKSLKENVLNNILFYVKNIFKQGISDYELNELLQLIYTINHLAIKQESILLHSGLINSISDLIYFSLLYYDKSINSLRVSILHLNELTFSSGLYNKMEEQNESEFNTSLSSFYTYIVSNGLNAAVISLKTIISYFHRMPYVEGKRFLITNAQYLIDFLNPIQHWRYKNIETLSENTRFRQIENEKINQLAKNIVFLAIYLYKYTVEENLNTSLVNEIALPLADNCQNVGKYIMMESESLLTDYYYDYRFNTPIDSIASSWFDTNPVHEAGGYTPSFYDYSSFWLSLSIYRKFRGRSLIPHREPTSEESWGRGELERFIKRLEEDEIKLISDLNEEEITRLKKEYLDHLKSIFPKNDKAGR